MGYHSKNSGGGSRFSRKTLALVSALGIGASASIFVVNADAAPKPRNESVYSDAEELGRNVIGEEVLGRLEPLVRGGEKEAKKGDPVTYEFEVEPGFPNDPNNVTAQRWMKIILTEDPKVPFDADGDQLKLKAEGISVPITFHKQTSGQWEAVLGAEYLRFDPEDDNNTQGAQVNNENHAQWKNPEGWPQDTEWEPPKKFTLKVPAKVKEDADGEFAKGSLKVISGRLVDVDLTDELTYKFVDNDKNGKCTWDATYKTRLTAQDAGYWLERVEVTSHPESAKDFEALPYAYQSIKPELVSGSINVNGEKYRDLTPVKPARPIRDADSPRSNLGYVIGESFVTKKVPPFYSDKWLNPAYPVEINFSFINPCGNQVNQWVVDTKPKLIPGENPTLAAGTLEPRPEITFVHDSGAYVGIVRPPEDASVTAEMKFKKSAPVAEFAVSKVLAQGQAQSVSLDKHSFTVQHDIKVTNKSETAGKFDVVSDTISVVPGFKVQSVTVDGEPANKVPVAGEPFMVSAGEQLAGKGEKTFKVGVTYVREQSEGKVADAFTEDEVAAIGTCVDNADFKKPAPKGEKNGIVNTVVLGGAQNDADKDLEGVNNNWDCVEPAQPQGSVSVGDFVWFDENHDGEQNNEEKGLAGVTLELYGSNDQPVTDIHGNIVESITTDSTGKYEFKDLPVLNGSDVYTVKVANFPSDYEPTVSGTGKIPAFKDSSTGSAKTTAGALSENGAKDNTLDFGFVKKEPETPKPEPEVAKFAVSKVLSETGKKFGNQSLAEQDNGEITVKHLIRVKNISDVAGKSAKVYDTPGTPAGMKIKSVMLADNPVELTAGGYKLSDGVELTPGAEAGFNVTVVYEPEQIPVGEDPEAAADEDAVEESDKPKVIFKDKATDLEKLGVCTPDNGTEYGIDEKLGFYNAVHMEGDADEEKAGNNWDCVSVNPPAEPERPIVPEFPINPTPPAPGEPRTPGFGWLVPLLPLIPFLGGVGSSQGSSAPVVPAPQNSPAPAAPQTVTPVPAPKPGERPQLARTGASVLGLLVMAVLLVVAGLGVMRMRRKEQ